MKLVVFTIVADKPAADRIDLPLKILKVAETARLETVKAANIGTVYLQKIGCRHIIDNTVPRQLAAVRPLQKIALPRIDRLKSPLRIVIHRIDAVGNDQGHKLLMTAGINDRIHQPVHPSLAPAVRNRTGT